MSRDWSELREDLWEGPDLRSFQRDAFERYGPLTITELQILRQRVGKLSEEAWVASGGLEVESLGRELWLPKEESGLDLDAYAVHKAAFALHGVAKTVIELKRRGKKYDLQKCRDDRIQSYARSTRKAIIEKMGEGSIHKVMKLLDEDEIHDLPSVRELLQSAADIHGGVQWTAIQRAFYEAGYGGEGPDRSMRERARDLLTLILITTRVSWFR